MMQATNATSAGQPEASLRTGAANQLRGGLNDLLGLSSPHCTPVSALSTAFLGREASDSPLEREEREDAPQEPLNSDEGPGVSPSSDGCAMELIGRGAYGCVYKSVWDGQVVAIKVGPKD